MREDTSPETPFAKSNSDPPPAAAEWRGPGRGANDALFGTPSSGARFDWAFATGKVRTFQASGPAGFALAMLVLLAAGALVALFFVFAVGVGTAIALAAGVAAALGLGTSSLRRRLISARRGELGPGDR